ncbi:hypothetical protein LTR08_002025 [Meristemomyces frigidus]|nr:hypothetical protein LTR08_002025 [Meristemomyces frigidus]
MARNKNQPRTYNAKQQAIRDATKAAYKLSKNSPAEPQPTALETERAPSPEPVEADEGGLYSQRLCFPAEDDVSIADFEPEPVVSKRAAAEAPSEEPGAKRSQTELLAMICEQLGAPHHISRAPTQEPVEEMSSEGGLCSHRLHSPAEDTLESETRAPTPEPLEEDAGMGSMYEQ